MYIYNIYQSGSLSNGADPSRRPDTLQTQTSKLSCSDKLQPGRLSTVRVDLDPAFSRDVQHSDTFLRNSGTRFCFSSDPY